MEVLGSGDATSIYTKQTRFQGHPFADERTKMIGLFGSKWACYIPSCLKFSFSFLLPLQYENNYNLNCMYLK
jgi:hypothetical protein